MFSKPFTRHQYAVLSLSKRISKANRIHPTYIQFAQTNWMWGLGKRLININIYVSNNPSRRSEVSNNPSSSIIVQVSSRFPTSLPGFQQPFHQHKYLSVTTLPIQSQFRLRNNPSSRSEVSMQTCSVNCLMISYYVLRPPDDFCNLSASFEGSRKMSDFQMVPDRCL